jgi:hypothetical protein
MSRSGRAARTSRVAPIQQAMHGATARETRPRYYAGPRRVKASHLIEPPHSGHPLLMAAHTLGSVVRDWVLASRALARK